MLLLTFLLLEQLFLVIIEDTTELLVYVDCLFISAILEIRTKDFLKYVLINLKVTGISSYMNVDSTHCEKNYKLKIQGEEWACFLLLPVCVIAGVIAAAGSCVSAPFNL